MTQPTRTEAIKTFLTLSTHKDLAELYSHDMECQVNVAADGGTRIDPTFNGRTYMAWTDGDTEWKPFRIPRNAGTNPEYTDVPMSFDIAAHAEGIGMTGWDWKNRVSRWVAFDFDAIMGHSERHTRKSTQEELKQIEQLLQGVPWINIRYSTSGRGLHLYVFLAEVPTNTHHEHSALARSILGQLSAFVGYDFSSKVDICGGNMWVWHRKMINTNVLLLIKSGTIFEDIPVNWKDHVAVVKGDRRKTLPELVRSGNQEDLFDELTSKSIHAELDASHRSHIEWLTSNGAYWYWDSDRNMLVTHTWFLKKMHNDLDLRGPFETISTGTERGTDHNCFCFPLRKGSWAVRRFTPGVAEHSSWSQDGAGWTRCFLNRDPDLPTLANSYGGKEKPTGGYIFSYAKAAMDTAIALGAEVTLAANLAGREASIKQRKDGKIIMEVTREPGDTSDKMDDWIATPKKWQRVFSIRNTAPAEPELADHDEALRHLVNEAHEDAGWVIKVAESWSVEPLVHVRLAVKRQGHIGPDVDLMLGNAIMKQWVLVNRPFQVEYPGGRCWNRNAAQLRFKPSKDKEKENLHYPTWIKLLDHLGEGLNEEIVQHPWCLNNGILSGADYLKCWIASLFQFPLEQLPYLFFYSLEQNTGKSSFHEAISLLLTQGAVVPASVALTSEASFNGELSSAILCVIEEVDLGKGRGKSLAYNRIKEWVTAKMFLVHPKSKTPYTIPNSTHWIQCANHHSACPILPGDSRITMISVAPIDPLELIPKRNLLELLQAEAPDFLQAILTLEVPPSNDRLNIPVITTQIKQQASRANYSYLESFIDEMCYEVDGEWIKYTDFYERFIEWLGPVDEKVSWTKHRVRDEIPPKFPYGAAANNQRYIGNIDFAARAPGEIIKHKLTVRDGKFFQNGRRI